MLINKLKQLKDFHDYLDTPIKIGLWALILISLAIITTVTIVSHGEFLLVFLAILVGIGFVFLLFTMPRIIADEWDDFKRWNRNR